MTETVAFKEDEFQKLTRLGAFVSTQIALTLFRDTNYLSLPEIQSQIRVLRPDVNPEYDSSDDIQDFLDVFMAIGAVELLNDTYQLTEEARNNLQNRQQANV